MNKKEIEDFIWENKEINTIGKVEAQNAIDLMQEDFDSRTCENCKHFIDEKGTKLQFCNARTEGGIIGWNGYGKDFGCNKFERKTDE